MASANAAAPPASAPHLGSASERRRRICSFVFVSSIGFPFCGARVRTGRLVPGPPGAFGCVAGGLRRRTADYYTPLRPGCKLFFRCSNVQPKREKAARRLKSAAAGGHAITRRCAAVRSGTGSFGGGSSTRTKRLPGSAARPRTAPFPKTGTGTAGSGRRRSRRS